MALARRTSQLIAASGSAEYMPLLGINLPGGISHWPQTESSGTVVDNAQGVSARDATYYTDANVTQQGSTFPTGSNVALYATSGMMRFGTASLQSVWDWNNFWFIFWSLPNSTEQSSTAANRTWLLLTGTGTTYLRVWHTTLYAHSLTFDHRPDGATGATQRILWVDWQYSPNYVLWAGQVAYPNAYLWRNGVQVLANEGTVVAATDSMNISNLNANALAGTAAGTFPHLGFGINNSLTTRLVNKVYESVYPASLELFACGDSKSSTDDYWISKLLGNLETSSGTEIWRERPYRVGLVAQTVAQLHTYLDTNLSGLDGNPTFCCVQIGANDLSAGTSESSFKTDLAGVIDALRARWPSTKVYVAQPWRRDYNTQAATMKSWVLAVIATYSQNVYAGPDETVWMENGDNGTTYTSDGTHYSNAGLVECAAQWQTVMGY